MEKRINRNTDNRFKCDVVCIISITSQTITNFTNISKCTNNITTSYAGICSILYNDCDKYYIGKTNVI